MGQTILLTCVGDTDPIRNFHDGALLHIARCKKPEKIVLFQSERSLKKRDRLIKALTSIPNYEPNVIDDPDIIKNDDVYLFDKMFEIIDKKVSHYMRDLTDEDQIILNLTSGTPEMIAAMFSVNRIKGLNVQAFQVMTPSKGSNKDIKHDNDVPIEDLINSNLDNKEIFESRIVQDKAERYGQELLKKRAIYYVNMYNYSAVLDLITSKSGNIIGKGKRKKVRRIIYEIEDNVKYQKNIPKTETMDLSLEEKNLLNEYLVIQLQCKRQFSTEVLMRVSALAEFAAKVYLNKKYGDVIKDREGKSYLNIDKYPKIAATQGEHADKSQNLIGYSIILSMFESNSDSAEHLSSDSVFTEHLKNIVKNKKVRNMVSHTLNEVPADKFNLNEVLNDCFNLVFETLDISKTWNDYYDNQNNLLRKLLS
ncbi:type III-A CRISPR-associated CARF protein Csm6 [Ligilactobacillus acidipiscis]|uniref:Csm6 CARF domain-containing protein n=3 Tax=Ligilactobacillus acidipiscis TaxID=89059 RepID=A0A0R2JYL8_9LACO|nr:hypothetical protein [Ligilactobacillus acidipiscis]KRN82318.1 hypothetical protein IV43_GL001636 [Ligilactobacillus acidipiscis]